MKLKCDKCTFEDLMENYHVFGYPDKTQLNIYIICPMCGKIHFCHHLSLPYVEPKSTYGCLTHLIAAPASFTEQEAREYKENKIVELKLMPIKEIVKKFADYMGYKGELTETHSCD